MAEVQTLDKLYDPRAVEPDIYRRWEESGAFVSKPDGRPHDQTFTIVIPPPNVTGALHLGHALNNTLQDILVRYHRMRGFNTLWQPGIDHAGIATQAVVERRIRESEGKTRHEIGREELVKRIWEWKDQYESRILSQLKLMGCSCDWDRSRFTLDDGMARAVRHMFFKLFKDGLIFRGKRLVNWDTQLQTAVSDDEVYHETVKGHFWHFAYPVIDPKPGEPKHVVIATTRPETMLGDTAVAVCPDPAKFFDKQEAGLRAEREAASEKDHAGIDAKLETLAERRASHLDGLVTLSKMAGDGRMVMLPLVERAIPLICDQWADPTKGSGCVKITPAHDPNDYEVGLRHDLPMLNVLTADGKIAKILEADGSENSHSSNYEGLTFTGEGRDKVVADLDALGLLHEVQDHQHELGHSDRSKQPIEPYLSDQWFVKTGDVAPDLNPEPQALACADSHPARTAPPSSRIRALPDLNAGATLLTWTTYGTWLPGDDRGSVSRAQRTDGTRSLHNFPGEPFDSDDMHRHAGSMARTEGEPVLLQDQHASTLLSSIAETAEGHGIELLAVAVMSNHVHVLCQGEQHGAKLLQLFKGNASRVLNSEFKLAKSPRWWTKSGSRRRIKARADLSAAIQYVRDQHQPLQVWSYEVTAGAAAEIVCAARSAGEENAVDQRGILEFRESARAKARGSGGVQLPNGKTVTGLAQAAMDAVEDGRVKVFPSRYGKSYLDWLGEKREWCISRQLWWGHRIPVWTTQATYHEWLQFGGEDVNRSFLLGNASRGKVAFRAESSSGESFLIAGVDDAFENLARLRDAVTSGRIGGDELLTWYGTIEDASFKGWDQEQRKLASLDGLMPKIGLEQDQDVLDTWFSSGLWPFSTLGWPEETAHVKQYYPGSVLCTSRDIITNWVARMVMFGLYAMGEVPFDHVYIHPKILDGRGETMSKSKGNGVDPVDVIHTHGADALRYTMADMTTETQDIRMPVEYVCPHCQSLVDQQAAIKAEQQSRKSRGEKLTRKLQPADCHRVKCTKKQCGKEFATQWADEALKKELGLARETSDKFDIGRNFCNKLWNAARFAFMNLEGTTRKALDVAALPPEDRWILAKLSQTVRNYHACLADYRFAASVKELRDFFWECLCDWYIELTKPRLLSTTSIADHGRVMDAFIESEIVGTRELQSRECKQVLAFCLDQVLRLWHPTIPFITERLWQQLNLIAPQRGLPGIVELRTGSDLIVADFPPVEGYVALDDEAIVATFCDLQDATRGVRDLRSQCEVSPKDRPTVTVVVSKENASGFEKHAHILKHMADIGELRVSTNAKRPKNAGSATVKGLRIYVHDVSDDDAERKRAHRALEGLEKQIKGKESKLGNEKFVANAKAEVVEMERKRLLELTVERDSMRTHLAELEG